MARRTRVGVAKVAEKGYWREGDARVVVGAWRRSGQTLSQFAEEHGVPPQRIARWATRIETRSRSTAVDFHPVRLIENSGGVDKREPIEVLLVDGRRVCVPQGFAVEELARVLAVLEGRVSC